MGKRLRKILFLSALVLLALGLDGTLTYDLFDFSHQPVAKVIGILLAVLILVAITWAETTQKKK